MHGSASALTVDADLSGVAGDAFVLIHLPKHAGQPKRAI
jgi:hypothetical protein